MHFGQENYVIPPMLDSFLFILKSVHICNYLQILNLNKNIFHIFNFLKVKSQSDPYPLFLHSTVKYWSPLLVN